MLMSKGDIYQWFQDVQGWNRMDFICNLIHLCNPFEVRFIGTCIEDMAQTDYAALKEQEDQANDLGKLEKFIKKRPSIDGFRSHISVCIALLESRNYKVAARVGDLLEKKLEGLNLQQLMEARLETEVEQWMLMLTLASYHPAFNFTKQLHFKKKLEEYEHLGEKSKKNIRGRQSSQRQRPAANHAEFEGNEWRRDMNSTHFARYPVYHQQQYVEYPNRSYPHPMQGNINQGYIIPPTRRPSDFPTHLASSTVIGDSNIAAKHYPANCMQNPDFPPVYPNCPSVEKTHMHPSAMSDPSIVTIWNNPAHGSRFPSSYSIPPVDNTSESTRMPSQSTVSQPQTFTNVTSVVSTVVTTSVASTGVTYSKISSQAEPRMSDHSEARSAFVTIPTSRNNETLSNKACYEIKSDHKLNTRNRSQSGDTTSDCRRNAKTRTVTQFIAQPLRSSASAPILATANPTKLTKGGATMDKNLSRSTTRMNQSARPNNVFVNMKKDKGKVAHRFILEVYWTDGTKSECDHTVQDIIRFYKGVNSKLGKNTALIDPLAKNTGTLERRQKLETIFRSFINQSVNDTNIEEFREFFKHNMPPPMSLPKNKRFKSVSRTRVPGDGSSSSSSTASPPLVNNTRSQILQSSVPRVSSMVTPPPSANSVSSASSLRSSPCTIANVPTNVQFTSKPSLDDRNDLYLKVYFWLQDRNLSDLYTFFKKYTFDEFCKLKPADIDAISGAPAELTRKMKEEMKTISKERSRESFDIDMGTITVLSKNLASSSDARDNGKNLDIRSVLDNVARQSEDEKSVSSQSAPVNFANCANATASDPCLSSEFEGADKTGPAFPSNNQFQQHAHGNHPDPDKGTKTILEPKHILSQGDVQSPTGLPSQHHYLPSAMNMRYCTSPYQTPQPMTYNWYPCAFNSCYLPTNSHKYIPTVPGQANLVSPVRTVPSPINPHSKPIRYLYTVATTVPEQIFRDNCNDSDIVVLSNHKGLSPSTDSEASCRSQPNKNPDVDNRSSPSSSDPDTTLKLQDEVVTAEPVYPDLPVATQHSNFYYAWQPRFVNFPSRPPPPIVHAANGSIQSYNDPGIYMPPIHHNFPATEPKHMNPSNYSPVLNGYPEGGRAPANNPNRWHNYGDGPKRDYVISCCNCGRKGHDAATCQDPNVADMLGTDFQLKISHSRKARMSK